MKAPDTGVGLAAIAAVAAPDAEARDTGEWFWTIDVATGAQQGVGTGERMQRMKASLQSRRFLGHRETDEANAKNRQKTS
jgi:hypothetical protein